MTPPDLRSLVPTTATYWKNCENLEKFLSLGENLKVFSETVVKKNSKNGEKSKEI